MQRSKAAVSVEVKRVIGALCRLLAAVGLDAVPAPEIFRRAKFGGGTEQDQFWQLLADILQTAGIVSSETRTQLGGERRKLVAAGLWQTGFHTAWMYQEDKESFSSRDLLLALGWLLAAGTLEKLLTQRVQQLDITLLCSLPESCEFSGDLEFDAASLRRLQWLIGRLRHQRRILLSTLRARTQALHHVFSASHSLSSGQSSAALQEDSVRLQQLCDLLEAYVNWKQVEKVFWTWMDSVIDLMDPCSMNSPRLPNGSPAACHHGDQRLEKLERFMKQEYSFKSLPEEAQTTQKESAFLPPSLLSSLPSIPAVCRARLQVEEPVKPPAVRPLGRTKGPHGGVEAPDELPASQAAELLLHAESALLQRRDRRRLANRMFLQELIDCLDDLVFIPL